MIGTSCILGRAPHTKETLPNFCEWCLVTRHPRVFCGLMGCQRDTPVLGRHTIIELKPMQPVDETYYLIPIEGANCKDLDRWNL